MSSKKSTLQKLRDRLLIEFPDYPREISRVDIETGKQLGVELLALAELIKAVDFGVEFDVKLSNVTELPDRVEERKAIVSINVKGVNRRPLIEIETRMNFLSTASGPSVFELQRGSDFRPDLERIHKGSIDRLKQSGRPYTNAFIKIEFDGKERFICEDNEIAAFNAGWQKSMSKGKMTLLFDDVF